MGTKVQINRTATPNNPPTGLLEGELSVEMADPTRLWVGVPTTIDPSGVKLLYSVDYYTKAEADSKFVELTGDMMTGPLTVAQGGGNTGTIYWGNTGVLSTNWDGANYNITMNVNCTGSIAVGTDLTLKIGRASCRERV